MTWSSWYSLLIAVDIAVNSCHKTHKTRRQADINSLLPSSLCSRIWHNKKQQHFFTVRSLHSLSFHTIFQGPKNFLDRPLLREQESSRKMTLTMTGSTFSFTRLFRLATTGIVATSCLFLHPVSGQRYVLSSFMTDRQDACRHPSSCSCC